MPVITEVTGVPIVYGPYVVEYTDIPTDGSTKVLWTPAIGDVVLGLFGDPLTNVNWNHGSVYCEISGLSGFFFSTNNPGTVTIGGMGNQYIAATTDPIVVRLSNAGDDPVPTQGHAELYAVVARALAPS